MKYKYMVYFPREILTIIYEYDNTYKEKYDIVIRQLRLLYAKHNLYIHNYMFHNDLFMNIYFQQHSLCYFAKRLKLTPF
jgi:hypothetical protein